MRREAPARPRARVDDLARRDRRRARRRRPRAAAIGEEPVSIEEVIERQRVAAGRAAALLLELELAGRVRQLAGKQFVRHRGLTRGRRERDVAKRSLVIVESPAKVKTIQKYLDSEYVVKASMGHVRDLPKSKLGVDVEKKFKPEYPVAPGQEEGARRAQEGGGRTPTRSTSRPTPTARARPSPGTSPRSSGREGRRRTASCSTRSPSAPCKRGLPAPAQDRHEQGRTRSRRAACSTASSATSCRRSCGRRCAAACPPAASSRSPCG